MGDSLNFPITKWGKSDASFVMATQWTLWPASKLWGIQFTYLY